MNESAITQLLSQLDDCLAGRDDRLGDLLKALGESLEAARTGLADLEDQPPIVLPLETGGLPPDLARWRSELKLESTATTGESGGPIVLLAAVPGSAGILWLERTKDRAWSPMERALVRHTAVAIGICCGCDPTFRSRRVASAARLGSRIAHDFDNVLTGVMGFTELAISSAAPDNRSFLNELMNVGEQGLAITRRLHLIGREPPADNGPTPLSHVMNAILADRERWPSGLVFDNAVSNELPLIQMGFSPLKRVMEEVVFNAVEASGANGRVRVSADKPNVLTRRLGDVLTPNHPSIIMITVCDNGPGVAKDVQPRLFRDPYVTTKPRHRGLGLNATYRTLYQFGAGLRIEANPAGGTIVQILVPTATESAQ